MGRRGGRGTDRSVSSLRTRSLQNSLRRAPDWIRRDQLGRLATEQGADWLVRASAPRCAEAHQLGEVCHTLPAQGRPDAQAGRAIDLEVRGACWESIWLSRLSHHEVDLFFPVCSSFLEASLPPLPIHALQVFEMGVLSIK